MSGGTDGIGVGFRGCMRSITVAATPVAVTEPSNKVFEGVTIGSCGLRDRYILSLMIRVI